MKKNKNRKSPLRRAVDEAEGLILRGQPPQQRVRICSFVPNTHRGLAALGTTEVRAMAVDLGCYHKPKTLSHRPFIYVVQDALKRLSLVTLQNAPSSVEGLLALGEHRVRYLVGLLLDWEKNPARFFVRKGRRDLTLEEVAHRVQGGLREYDIRESHYGRDRMPDLELFEIPPEDPPPKVPAKALRLAKRRREYIASVHGGYISTNRSNAPGRNKKRKYRRSDRVSGTLRCGCRIEHSVPNAQGYFRVSYINVSCMFHRTTKGKLAQAVLHVSELAREKKKRRSIRSGITSRRAWTPRMK